MKSALAAFLISLALITNGSLAATRLKELVSLEGVRDNQLMGYGLAVGLAGTGDRRQTVFSAQSLDEPAGADGLDGFADSYPG